MKRKVVPGASAREKWAIDARKSSLTVHVFKAGLLSALGHDHDVRANVSSGSIAGGDEPAVQIAVDARRMKVLESDLAEEKRAEVEEKMLGPEVLHVAKFPKIRFESTAVAPAGEGRWRVEGVLELRGKSAPLSFHVTLTKKHFRGSATVSQRAFGIEPISAVAGTVKVKDGVRIDFEIATVPEFGSPSRRPA